MAFDRFADRTFRIMEFAQELDVAGGAGVPGSYRLTARLALRAPHPGDKVDGLTHVTLTARHDMADCEGATQASIVRALLDELCRAIQVEQATRPPGTR